MVYPYNIIVDINYGYYLFTIIKDDYSAKIYLENAETIVRSRIDPGVSYETSVFGENTLVGLIIMESSEQ